MIKSVGNIILFAACHILCKHWVGVLIAVGSSYHCKLSLAAALDTLPVYISVPLGNVNSCYPAAVNGDIHAVCLAVVGGKSDDSVAFLDTCYLALAIDLYHRRIIRLDGVCIFCTCGINPCIKQDFLTYLNACGFLGKFYH